MFKVRIPLFAIMGRAHFHPIGCVSVLCTFILSFAIPCWISLLLSVFPNVTGGVLEAEFLRVFYYILSCNIESHMNYFFTISYKKNNKCLCIFACNLYPLRTKIGCMTM